VNLLQESYALAGTPRISSWERPRKSAASMLLSEFLPNVYIPSRIELAPRSAEQMAMTVRLFDRWHGSAVAIEDLSEDLVRGFLADLRRSRAAATVNSKRCHLLALWRCAYEEEYLERPPRATKIRRANAQPRIPEAWTPAEVGRILRSAYRTEKPIGEISSGDWFISFLLVVYDTGERRGAMLETKTADVDLAGGSITFRRTKTGRQRLCRLHATTVSACARIHYPERELMWPMPFSREALEKRFRKILARAGVRFGRGRGGLFHKLRRTSGTLVEANGGDGAKHLGNTRAVFEASYLDPRFARNDLQFLPRPE